MKYVLAAAALGATCVEAFAPSPLSTSTSLRRAHGCARRPLSLRMDEKVELKPLIDIKPIDYANEPTQFQRQGLVDSGVPTPKVYTPALGGGDGFGGLSRREAIASGGAAALGLFGVLWAVTRNPGYDRKDTSRDAGKVEVNAEVLKNADVQAGLALLTQSRSSLAGISDAFQADKNAQISAEIRKKFDIVKLRDAMNKLTFALDEDVQIKTDKIVRSVIQDLQELEQASALKEGAARTPKRIAATEKWFTQALADYDRFLAYFPAPSPAAPARPAAPAPAPSA